MGKIKSQLLLIGCIFVAGLAACSSPKILNPQQQALPQGTALMDETSSPQSLPKEETTEEQITSTPMVDEEASAYYVYTIVNADQGLFYDTSAEFACPAANTAGCPIQRKCTRIYR